MHLADSLGPRQKLGTINSYFNSWPYRQDRELYGLSEYWATPLDGKADKLAMGMSVLVEGNLIKHVGKNV